LGVNVDHVATVRQARGGDNPDPVRAAILAQSAGADGITAHLREGPAAYLRRRHRAAVESADDSAQSGNGGDRRDGGDCLEASAACRVHRTGEAGERTTEGGIEARGPAQPPQSIVAALGAARIRVSMFIEPDQAAA
jgi:pyridoxine 5-phosphate synthase